MAAPQQIRNLAIIAHVDHGKTTLVDALLTSAGALDRGEGQIERAMDSGDLEKERGITITSKPTSVTYGDVRINLVDTPGHADFGGEVERVLNMVDAVLVVVDAFEGPMPQTRFVTEKAVGLGLKILLVVNKIDRPGAEPHKTVDATFDLLAGIGASEEQLDFPVIFCSARERYAMSDPADEKGPMSRILDFIVQYAPPPVVHEGGAALWVSTLDYDPFLGFVAIGRIRSGRISVGDRLAQLRHPPRPAHGETGGPPVVAEVFRVRRLLGFQGLRRFEREYAEAGDLIAIAGMETLQVGDTLTTEEPSTRHVFPRLDVDPPTMTMRFRVNDGPFAGREGKWVTSRKLAERLEREVRSNVALRVSPGETAEEFEVAGRGELHLGVLIETMRREGYELCVSRPKVILRRNENDELEEPYENLIIQCDQDYSGSIIDKLSQRGGELRAMDSAGPGRTRLEMRTPTRSLIGYRSEMLTDTRGTGIMAATFAGYGPYLGPRKTRPRGVLIVMEPGETFAYSLGRLQDRGVLFIGDHVQVYAGQILGEHSRENDLVVNPCIAKKFTNIRSAGADEKIFLTPPLERSLEQALAYIEDDELLEVTPKSLRLRKRDLDHNRRKREAKAAAG
ncbi:translational GTPase TypA [Nannocystis sp. ILAH1]|uniref:translational GTPase TypA n=1 Tax=unclassified Nannocystis TaxID=2627009 RepID=UPI0022701A58|nr:MULTISPECIES: translational GTPase TypA [unclassified Nannocystis]MCY0993604.1 translational GTPase TypA [Nannocystis sp. ILAH1]MCY1063669.1 translational GTPase TypA [Nannocystis sp. RBIL2]